MRPLIYLVLLLFSFAPYDMAWATRYALLIGVGEYQADARLNLQGPTYDVGDLQALLTTRWHFPPEHISVLLNRDATRANILAALQKLVDRSQPGDQIFIYLSGHGTSAKDEANPMLSEKLPDNSGAFVPHDFPIFGNLEEQVANLIIGKRDLRPLLEQLDRGERQVFVVADSCYSGNAVRSLFRPVSAQLQSRLLPGLNNTDFTFESDLASDDPFAGTREEEEYPYKNVIFIAAASDRETAADISRSSLDRWPTLSGEPHGAFTDTLLRVLAADLPADTNGDGLSYQELYTAASWYMDKRGYGHFPQLLPRAQEDVGSLATRKVFGESESVPRVASAVSVPALRVHVTDPDSPLNTVLSQLAGVELTDQQPDLRLRQENNDTLLLNAAWDLVVRLENAAPDDVVQRLQRQIRIKQLLELAQGQAPFELRMDLRNGGIALMEGEFLQLDIRADRTVYLLLFNINSHGELELFYPASRQELQPVQTLSIPDGFKMQVTPPFGTDQLIAYGFSEPKALLQKFADLYQTQLADGIDSPKLPADSSLSQELIQVLTQEQHAYRRATQLILTVPKATN